MHDIYTRATAIFGKASGGGIRWPYGVADPCRSNYPKPEDAERYEEVLRSRRAAQQLVVEWAGKYGLKTSDSGCCPQWLQRRASRRCMSDACTHYGSSTSAPDHGWLDHMTAWLQNGKPVAITSAPYSISKDDEQRFAWWQQHDPRLRVASGTGWYGFGTTQIIVWRSDLVTTMEPA
ncbi:hypothetical protein [Streptomyces sp. NPDC018031]|uniref:hypothetical protein n=1 Tax=Streptomyces sp. NPDC018031 TaxID=3365033 RepID=UPI0037941C91